MSFFVTVVAIGDAAAVALAEVGVSIAIAEVAGAAVIGGITGAVVNGTIAAVTGGNIGKGIIMGGLVGGVGGGLLDGIGQLASTSATAAESAAPKAVEAGVETGSDALNNSVSSGLLNTAMPEAPTGLVNSATTTSASEPWSSGKTLAMGTGLSAIGGVGSGYMQAQGAKTAAKENREAQAESENRLIASRNITTADIPTTGSASFTKTALPTTLVNAPRVTVNTAPVTASAAQNTGSAATAQTTNQSATPQSIASTMDYRNLTQLTGATA